MPHPQNDGGYAVGDFDMRNQKGTLLNDVWTGIEQLRKMRMHPCFAADAAVYTLDCGNHAILALSREKKMSGLPPCLTLAIRSNVPIFRLKRQKYWNPMK